MIFLAQNLIVNPSSIIELCVKRSQESRIVVTVLSPNKEFLSSVFIYGKPVRNNQCWTKYTDQVLE